MPKITPESLLTLEAYARERARFRARVIEHKKLRSIALGEHVTLQFEDELTVRYQIQEMLRIERIFEQDGIQEELDVYSPLVPDGRNFKATMMLEFPDPEERKRWLARLVDIEDRVWVQVDGHEKSWAVADEDLDRETDDKTSSVHFLRFELDEQAAEALKRGAALQVGVDHPMYQAAVNVPQAVRDALVKDLA
ncbi:MAG: hypothetical protein A2W04_00325 [Betaproteobacteria bacterium RBG_16_64_9]|nr:MAG: hypothetical protein A2W04_00325 [Betaproteobacteria bacterium RBG_16_64_9]OGA36655.1 MAG: hypothetical protein A3G80_11285 [Betaproteobacteria bacterium RIFCSPLOWO2_12_FULL_62_13b]